MIERMHIVLNRGAARALCVAALVAVLAPELSGCATSADSGDMTVAAQPTAQTFPQRFKHAMCVRTVSGGEETNPLWVSKVDDEGFRTALSASLDGAGLTAPSDGCAFPIDANLLGMSQPSLGLDMTVTSHVNYKVYDQSGQPVLLATIDAPYTATFSDSPLGFVRLKRANEGAIRVSIQDFFDKLRDVDPKQNSQAEPR